VINIGKSLVKENLRDSQDIECVSDSLKDTYKKQEDAIITLLENNNIYITKKETALKLRNKNLKDEEFKLISLIKFNQLQEINLSENNIKNIEPFRKMNLPYLEYLDMSNNKIVHVSPITEINSKILTEIYLQNNEIYDFSPFLHAEFPKLELLRIDNNRFDSSSGTFKNLKSKYYNELIYEPKTFEEFNKKFSTNIEFLKTENINLTNSKGGNGILKELYNIIPFENNIKQLILTNIDLSDTSVLIRLPFFNLEKLDLTLNNLTNIKFLYKMKLQNLKNLYLNDNKINDISALIGIEIPNIEIITLYHNNITNDDQEAKEIVSSLKQKNVLIILKGDE
jgi:Leucine-rich repeat (LRR) protein